MDTNTIPYWLRLAAEVRPMLDFLPGVDGEYLAYLVDRVTQRNGADIDEYRVLQSLAYDARRIGKMNAEVRIVDESGCRAAVQRLAEMAQGGLLPSVPMPDTKYLHPDDAKVIRRIGDRQAKGASR